MRNHKPGSISAMATAAPCLTGAVVDAKLVVDTADSVVLVVVVVPVTVLASLRPLLDELVTDVGLVVVPEGFSGGEVWIVKS